MDAFMGEIRLFAGNYAPHNWALCAGQILPISQHQALFSILGTTYGGDGRTTFALPDLRGRVAISAGQGTGLSNRALGQQVGQEEVTLTDAQMPTHNHAANCQNEPGTQTSPVGQIWAATTENCPTYGAEADGTMHKKAIGNAGGNQAHTNMQPSLVLSYIICLEGIYPSRG